MGLENVKFDWSISLGNIITMFSIVSLGLKFLFRAEKLVLRADYAYRAVIQIQQFLGHKFPLFNPIKEDL